MEQLKLQVKTLAQQLGITFSEGKEIRFEPWLQKASAGKTQQQVFELIDAYNAYKALRISLKKTLRELKAKKEIRKPTALIIKGYGFIEIYDCAIKDCGVPRFDKEYKDFLVGYDDPTKPPTGWFTKIFPTIYSEVQLFTDTAQVVGYLKYLLKGGIERAKIRRMMKYFFVGRDALQVKLNQLKEKFCVEDGAGTRGLAVYHAKHYRIPTAIAVHGEGGFARMMRI